MPRLTKLSVSFEFDSQDAVRPLSIGADNTGNGWKIVYQRWGMVVLEEIGTECEHAATVQFAVHTRERVELVVTLLGVGGVQLKSETVRVQELDLCASRMLSELLGAR